MLTQPIELILLANQSNKTTSVKSSKYTFSQLEFRNSWYFTNFFVHESLVFILFYFSQFLNWRVFFFVIFIYT